MSDRSVGTEITRLIPTSLALGIQLDAKTSTPESPVQQGRRADRAGKIYRCNCLHVPACVAPCVIWVGRYEIIRVESRTYAVVGENRPEDFA